MKKKLFSYISLFLFTGLLILASCSKNGDGPNIPPNPDPDDDQTLVKDTPGNIIGMGKSTSTPGGKAFKLPEGIKLVESIRGDNADLVNKSALSKKAVKNDFEYAVDTILGSGYFATYFQLENTTEKNIEVEFPAKHVMVSESAEVQNLISLKKTTITISANSILGIRMLVYGVNNDKENPTLNNKYKWGVTSNSSTISDFCALFKGKKINCNEYNLSSTSNQSSYELMTVKIQDYIGQITDSARELQEGQIEWIESLPNTL